VRGFIGRGDHMRATYTFFAGQSVERPTLLSLDLRDPVSEAIHFERALWDALLVIAIVSSSFRRVVAFGYQNHCMQAVDHVN
jgi:hypothetical protein